MGPVAVKNTAPKLLPAVLVKMRTMALVVVVVVVGIATEPLSDGWARRTAAPPVMTTPLRAMGLLLCKQPPLSLLGVAVWKATEVHRVCSINYQLLVELEVEVATNSNYLLPHYIPPQAMMPLLLLGMDRHI